MELDGISGSEEILFRLTLMKRSDYHRVSVLVIKKETYEIKENNLLSNLIF
jgi:hypothetical protein